MNLEIAFYLQLKLFLLLKVHSAQHVCGLKVYTHFNAVLHTFAKTRQTYRITRFRKLC